MQLYSLHFDFLSSSAPLSDFVLLLIGRDIHYRANSFLHLFAVDYVQLQPFLLLLAFLR